MSFHLSIYPALRLLEWSKKKKKNFTKNLFRTCRIVFAVLDFFSGRVVEPPPPSQILVGAMSPKKAIFLRPPRGFINKIYIYVLVYAMIQYGNRQHYFKFLIKIRSIIVKCKVICFAFLKRTNLHFRSTNVYSILNSFIFPEKIISSYSNVP